MAFSFDIKGLDNLQKKLQQKPKEAEEVTKKVLVKYVTKIHAEQVRRASRFTDRGAIVQGLGWLPAGNLNYVLFSQAPHSAYREFGTGKKFQSIPEVDASVYRGATGKKGLYSAILAWVKRKGIAYGTTFSVKTRRKKGGKAQDRAEKAAAFAIYRDILKNGTKPSPFFFAPFLVERQTIKDELETELNKI